MGKDGSKPVLRRRHCQPDRFFLFGWKRNIFKFNIFQKIAIFVKNGQIQFPFAPTKMSALFLKR
jgi:hypothetical protein